MKIAVLLSGGVDSSVALQLLKNEGKHDITAFYLKIWLEDEMSFLGNCPWEEDLEFVRAICEKLDVPLKIIPLQQEYHQRVVSYVVDELKKGRTPSPDILCNERVKFGAFFDFIDESYEKVASGHYAQVEQIGDKFMLKRAPDPVKDQTYFLSSLSQKQLRRAMFPIGHLQKNEVRDLAREFDLPTKTRKDSQGICFLGKIKYNDFVKFNLGEKKGDIIEIDTGKKWGEHNGFWFHTIGQRKGLDLHGGPWYVVGKDIHKNIVYISHKENRQNNARSSFITSTPHWITGEAPEETMGLQCKLRHGPELIGCSFITMDNGDLAVQLTQKDSGVAPGQSVIFYKDTLCLGRAIITK